MVRAAAKNHAHVGVVVDPDDYSVVLDELRADGALGGDTRRRLARSAFAQTAAYDAAIVTWLDDAPAPEAAVEASDDVSALPGSIHLALELAQPLRYGENPHQQGARYGQVGATSWWDSMTQHGGKELSYLNVFDTEAAWRLVQRFDGPACVVVKHANPCGVAVADRITDAYVRANACDPVSAFGGIVALNRTVPADLAVALAEVFTEVIVAPAFDDDALELLAKKKNLRVISAGAPAPLPFDLRPHLLVHRRPSCFPRFRQNSRTLPDPQNIQNQGHPAIAHDRRARINVHALQLLAERLHDNLLRIVNPVHYQAELLVLRLQHDNVGHRRSLDRHAQHVVQVGDGQ